MRLISKYVMLIAMVAFCSVSAIADDKNVNTKFGKPTKQELEMTVYEPDPEAEAVILSKLGEAEFKFDDAFRVTYKFETRIKVLKQEGAEYANVEIPFYYVDNSAMMRDEVAAIKGYSFNLEDGKVVKTELKKDMIFEERLIDNYYVIKFSIPNVKVGSVVEYKYEIRSTRIPYMRSWYAQDEIPTIYSYFETTIPKYFKFNLSPRGYGAMDVRREKTNMRMDMSAIVTTPYVTAATYNRPTTTRIRETIEVEADHIEIEAKDLPAMREDDYIYGIRDFICHVDFEMMGVEYPGEPFKSYSTTWESVDKTLLKAGFDKAYTMKNPYPEANEQIGAIEGVNGKVAAIVSYVADRIKWDGKYNMATKKVDEAINLGSGSNATINCVMMSMMRDAGIECYAVALRLRKNGMLVQFMPSLDNFDSFAVAYVDENGSMHFIDGSNARNSIDVLPLQMLVENARIIAEGYAGPQWVNLTKLCRNVSQTAITATVDAENGIVNAKEQQKLRGQLAAVFQRSYDSAPDSTEFVKALASAQDISINDMEIKNTAVGQSQIVVISDYDKAIDVTDSLVYLCPTIVPLLDANPFTAEKREIPVCFPYSKEQVTSVNITIPEGYIVDELPESVVLQSENKEMQYIYKVSASGNMIVVMSKFVQNEMLYPVEKYELLRSFYTYIADKCNEMIVLRKQ